MSDRESPDDGAPAPTRTPAGDPAIPRAIVGFHTDDEGHWVADLECGHTHHVRHEPPWQNRPWVATPEGRARFVGVLLPCVKCARPPDDAR